MRHGRRFTVALATLALVLAVTPLHAAEPLGQSPLRWQVSVLPLGRLASFLVAPFRTRPTPVASAALARQDGWRSLSFALDDHGVGVYLSIRGEAQFDVAYIDYADGGQDRIELAQASRADGTFALAEYAAERPVARVSLLARAVSREARIHVLLGR